LPPSSTAALDKPSAGGHPLTFAEAIAMTA
jgi:hypothetical protein